MESAEGEGRSGRKSRRGRVEGNEWRREEVALLTMDGNEQERDGMAWDGIGAATPYAAHSLRRDYAL